jgi:hypothetical protein
MREIQKSVRRIFNAEQFSQFINYPLIGNRRIVADVFLIKHLPQLSSQLDETFAPWIRVCPQPVLIAAVFTIFSHDNLKSLRYCLCWNYFGTISETAFWEFHYRTQSYFARFKILNSKF